MDEVKCGLPIEYAAAIVDTVLSAAVEKELPSGTMIFDSGAYAQVGSSQAIFSKATNMLLQLLLNKPYAMSEEGLKDSVVKML